MREFILSLLALIGLSDSLIRQSARMGADAAVEMACSVIVQRPAPNVTVEPGTATVDQLKEIKSLAETTQWSTDQQKDYLGGPKINKSRFTELSHEQAVHLIKELQRYKGELEKAKTKPTAQPVSGCANGSCSMYSRRW